MLSKIKYKAAIFHTIKVNGEKMEKRQILYNNSAFLSNLLFTSDLSKAQLKSFILIPHVLYCSSAHDRSFCEIHQTHPWFTGDKWHYWDRPHGSIPLICCKYYSCHWSARHTVTSHSLADVISILMAEKTKTCATGQKKNKLPGGSCRVPWCIVGGVWRGRAVTQ